jgi:hypothetical protein
LHGSINEDRFRQARIPKELEYHALALAIQTAQAGKCLQASEKNEIFLWQCVRFSTSLIQQVPLDLIEVLL